MFLVKNSKSPFYQVVYFVNGKRTTTSTKEKDKPKAERFLKTFKPEEQQEIQQPSELTRATEITLLQFKEEYTTHIEPTISAAYLRSIKLSFSQFEEFLGNVQLIEIDLRTVDRFITSTFSRTKRGAHLYYRTLKAAFTKAVAWEYIKENPFKKIKLPRIAKNKPVFISPEEVKIIVSKTKEPFLKDIFLVAFYTGMRLGELVNMKWNWYDQSQATINTKCSEEFITKGKKERSIPANLTVQNILQKRIAAKNGNSFVFTNDKRFKLNEDFVSKKFKQAVRDAVLSDEIHFHTLRHSFASVLVQKGVSLYVVKELLGHENIATTQIYSHLQRENLSKAIALL
ncbi:site-specific recombinase xerd [hydrocarbon metagenome]|uniref:Site-specific recombinase xerd n=1 Tax=hydrocarbon metagenome TaxID=938273 RepID=A0A0W8G008_9ZZZZ